MGARITEPGFYFDMSAVDYFADPCPTPSLSQSIAKKLIAQSPRHAWVAHPRLNPAFEADEPTKYDIGNIAHSLLLGRGKQLEIIDADNWLTKAAKEARAAALDHGKLGILTKHYEVGVAMVAAARSQLAERGFEEDWAPENGHGEVILAWREGSTWCRSMIDWLSTDRRRIWDYKTTGASAAPHGLPRKAVDDGWDVQAAMHGRGLDGLDHETAGRRQHFFVCQEDEAPFALTVVRLPESYLTMGRKKLTVGFDKWTAAMESGQWPLYPAETLVPQYPEFLERQWLDREVAEHANGKAPIRGDRAGTIPSLMGG